MREAIISKIFAGLEDEAIAKGLGISLATHAQLFQQCREYCQGRRLVQLYINRETKPDVQHRD